MRSSTQCGETLEVATVALGNARGSNVEVPEILDGGSAVGEYAIHRTSGRGSSYRVPPPGRTPFRAGAGSEEGAKGSCNAHRTDGTHRLETSVSADNRAAGG